MDGNLSKALWIGVSILLFIAVVTLGLSIFGGMKDTANMANDRIGAISQSLAEEDYRIYDGKEVKGDKVLSALGNFSGRSGEVIILVATLGRNSGNPINLDPTRDSGMNINYYTEYISETNATLSSEDGCIILSGGSGELLTTLSKTKIDSARRDAENPNKTDCYINPSGKFISHLIYDENRRIMGLIFAQME